MTTATADQLDRAITRLRGIDLRAKRFVASTTILASTLGFALAIVMIARGLLTTTDVVLFVVMYAVHMGGVTIGYHRYLAHRTFRTSRWLEAVLLAAAATALQGPVVFWVATHRLHHRFADREGDPHSPHLHGAGLRGRLRGLWWAHMPWMLSDLSARWSRFAPDILRNRRLYFYQRTYPLWAALGLAVPALAGYLVDHTALAALGGLVFGGLARAFVANQAAWCVGSVCHMIGSRPFRTADHSTNNWPVAILTFGEGLQNNHHAFPGCYRHAIRWWEPDISGWVIGLLGRANLAQGLKMPTPEAIARHRAGGSTPPTPEPGEDDQP